ncbi:MAG: hypothetical protein LIO43_06010 [Clostridiales bacterium]|nr:hypothetical protein [Clostridiales bacterium]
MNKEKSSKKKAIIILAAAVAAVCVISAITVSVQRRKSEDNYTISQKDSSAAGAVENSQPSNAENSGASAVSQSEGGSSGGNQKDERETKVFEAPLTLGETLDLLSQHYGSNYKVNATVEENGLYYFAVYNGNEKYASVSVDLNSGRAQETIISTGKQSDFPLAYTK